MKYITLPRTDCTISALAFGTASIGVKNTEREAHALLDRYMERGGNVIDTARVYSDWVPGEIGRSERIIGDWLETYAHRKDVFVATKGAHPELTSMNKPRMRPVDIRSDVDKSLKALKIDTIDLYYLHRDDPETPVSRIIETLDSCVRAGKIRYIACSNWRPSRMKEAVEFSESEGLSRFVANQVLWNIGSSGMMPKNDPSLVVMDKALLDTCVSSEVGIAAFSCMAGGFFEKMLSGSPEVVENAHTSAYYTRENRDLIEYLTAHFCRSEIAGVTLGFLLNRSAPVLAIAGPRTTEQLDIAIDASDFHIDENILKELDAQSGLSTPG